MIDVRSGTAAGLAKKDVMWRRRGSPRDHIQHVHDLAEG
jgi:hypothetical protein